MLKKLKKLWHRPAAKAMAATGLGAGAILAELLGRAGLPDDVAHPVGDGLWAVLMRVVGD